ncbi:MAG: long-chain fatty acid--CoA ligase, partial [Acidimicrobiia bacterium]|nr:long-chain fatty acid--CoA ligase [Acidimicrobiia bacterium]
TETASSIALLGPEDHRAALKSDVPAIRARLASVGRALPGVEIEVHDRDGRRCPPGEIGDIVVRGPQVAGEYLETGTRAEDGGWFPTRDLGYMDTDGFIFVQGRADDTIIRGGENIAPSEIEDVLAQHPWVADAAVAGIPDEEWGHRIGAFIVPKPGARPDAAALREYTRAHLRSSKTPDEIVFVPELPTTPTGKILRRKLVELLPERADAPTA